MTIARLGAATVLLAITAVPPASAQTKDAFVRALLDFTTAIEGTYGDEGPLVVSSIEAMAAGLAEWNGVIGRMEAGLAADIRSAPPPVAARMRAALGAAYLERGRLQDALRELEASTKLDPQFASAHVLRGLALEGANRSREAAESQRLAWRIDRSDPGSAYRLARAGPEIGNSTEAQEALTALGRAVDDQSSRTETRAPALVTVGLFDEASVTAPVFAPAAYAAAYELLQDAKYETAIEAIRTRAAADPLITDAALKAPEVQKAIEALRQERPGDAVAQLNAVAQKWSGASEFHRILGTAYWRSRDYAKSAEQLRTAIRLNRFDERSRLVLADVLVAAQDPIAARQVLEEAVGTLPQAGAAYWRLARLRQSLGDESGARESFEKTAALVPLTGSAHVHMAIGRLYHNQLDLDRAALAYRKRVDAVLSDPVAHADLGEVLRAQDRLDQALGEFLIAALLDASYARAFAAVGQIHAAAGRDNEAARMLRRAVDLAPSQLEARYALSRALMRLGKTEEAEQELQTFQELQSKAMEEERRRFQENLLKIEDALKNGAAKGSGR